MRFFQSFISLLLLSGCLEKNTTDPIDSYAFWAGTRPPEDVEVLNGQYWESAHWSKEFILYLRLRSSEEWWNELIRQNNLEVGDLSGVPGEWPDWFHPSDSITVYASVNAFDGSRFIKDHTTGDYYIYIIQL